MDAKEIGAVLREMRNKSGISVKTVSAILKEKAIRASEKTVYSWEAGNSQPNPDVLLMLCELYGVEDVLQAFGYKRNRPPEAADPEAPVPPDMTSPEAALLAAYRRADEDTRTIVETALRRYLNFADLPPGGEPAKEAEKAPGPPGLVLPIAARGGGKRTKQVTSEQVDAARAELAALSPEEADL